MTSGDAPGHATGTWVFVSYGRDEHAGFARRLADDLGKSGYKVWFDLDGIKPGVDWEDAIDEGIAGGPDGDHERGLFVMVMTPHAVRRPDGYCLNEIARALSRGLRPIPIMLVWCEPPLSVCRLQFLDMQDCANELGSLIYEAKFQRLLRVLADPEDLESEGHLVALRRVLSPLDFQVQLLRVPGQFFGRAAIMQRMSEWIADDSCGRVLTLVGEPGIGKTALAVHIAHTFPEVSAVHFCSSQDRTRTDVRRFVATLVYTLATQIPQFSESLQAVEIQKLMQVDSGEQLFEKCIARFFKHRSRPERSIVILIDALDEASEGSVNELAHLLAKAYTESWLPDWFRAIVTTRSDPVVLQKLHSIEPQHLDLRTNDNEDDLRAFVERELRRLSSDRALVSAAAERVSRRSNGNFLIAHYVCDALRRGHMTLDQFEHFPTGLNEVYAGYCEGRWPITSAFPGGRRREDPRRLAEYRGGVRLALAVIIAAREAVPARVLRDALGWSDDQKSDFVRQAGALIKESSGTVLLFHKTLGEWITSSERALLHHVDVSQGHRLLAELALREYRSGTLSGYLARSAIEHLIRSRAELPAWPYVRELLSDVRYVEQRLREGAGFDLLADFELIAREFGDSDEGYREVLRLGRACAKARLFTVRFADAYEPAGMQSLHNLRARALRKSATTTPAARIRGIRVAGAAGTGQAWTFEQQVENWFTSWSKQFRGAWVSVQHDAPLDLSDESLCIHSHRDIVSSVDVSRDSKRIVSGARRADPTVRVWNASSGKRELELPMSAGAVCVGFQEDVVLAIDAEGRVWRWDLDGGGGLDERQPEIGPLAAAALSNDRNVALLAGVEGALLCWDLRRQIPIWHQPQGLSQWTCVALYEARFAVAGNSQGEIWTFELRSGAVANHRAAHAGVVRAVVTDSQHVYSGGDDGRVLKHDLSSYEEEELFGSATDSIAALYISPEGATLAWALGGVGVRTWPVDRTIYVLANDEKAGTSVLAQFQGSVDTVYSLHASPQLLCTGGREQRIRVWRRASAAPNPAGSDLRWVNMLRAVSARRFLTASDDGSVRIWDAQALTELARFPHQGSVYACLLSPDETLVCSSGFGSELELWSRSSGQMLARVPAGAASTIGAVFDKTGRFLIFGDDGGYGADTHAATAHGTEPAPGEGNAREPAAAAPDEIGRDLVVWDVPRGTAVARIPAGPAMSYRRALCVTPDNRYLVGALGARGLGVWTLPEGALVDSFPTGLEGETIAVVLHPSGRIIAVSDELGRVRGLSLTGEVVFAIERHGEHVRGLAFSRDGELLALGCDDHTVTFWAAQTGTFVAAVDVDDWVTDLDALGADYAFAVALAAGHIATVRVVGLNAPYPAIVTAGRHFPIRGRIRERGQCPGSALAGDERRLSDVRSAHSRYRADPRSSRTLGPGSGRHADLQNGE